MIRETLREDKRLLIALFLYTFLLIFFNSKMSPLYPLNDWSDVNLYFNMGKAMFNGKTLYTEDFDHKGPFIFIIYGLGYLISNTSFLGVFIIQVLCWILLTFFAYLTARLYLDKIYAFIASMVFPVLALSHASQGGSAEEFILVFEVVSLYFFIRYFEDENASEHKPAYMLMHGLMCVMVLFTKINLVIFWFFPLLAIFINLILKKEYKNLVRNILFFIIGLSIIALPICLYLLINGALTEAWDIYINLNRSYAKIGSLYEVVSGLISRFYMRLRFETFDFVIVLLGALYFPLRYIRNRVGKVAIILSFVSVYTAIFVTPGYVYYYAIPYYVFSLLGCIAILSHFRVSNKPYVYIIFYILILIWGINQQSFFGYKASELFTHKKEEVTFATKFADIIGKEKNPTLMNLGLDAANSIFTRLDIIPNVRYFVSPNLPYKIYPRMVDTQTECIRNKEVQFIVLTEGYSWFKYFFTLPDLYDNYEIVDTYLNIENHTHYLFKRKNY